ncbi:MAG: isoleucine--tRNA ligase, partial [Deltaproteobacteria bacterium]|nr:isoleucine--tRNA ligase [Deltaproteobacteria bacterium]
LRAAENARVRQPLRELVVAGRDVERIRPYLDLIADEVNVKNVSLSGEFTQFATFGLRVHAKLLGPRLGAEMKKVIAAAKQGEWTTLEAGGVEVAGHALQASEYELTLQPLAGVACQALPSHDTIVVLDLELSTELVQEGMARDVVRVVQQARKEAGLHVADRIRLVVPLDGDWREAVERFRDYVSEQTLASELHLEADASRDLYQHAAQLGGETVRIGLARMG